MWAKQQFIIVILCVVGASLTEKHKFYLRWITEKVTCAKSSSCASQFCGLLLKSRYERLINVWCYVDASLVNASLHYRLNYRVRGVYHKFLIEGTEDLCNLFQWYNEKDGKTTRSVSKLFEYTAPIIMPYTHTGARCPITGNMSIFKDLILHEYWVPSLMPTGQYRLDFDLYGDGKKSFELQWFGSLGSQATQLKQLGAFDVHQAVFDSV